MKTATTRWWAAVVLVVSTLGGCAEVPTRGDADTAGRGAGTTVMPGTSAGPSSRETEDVPPLTAPTSAVAPPTVAQQFRSSVRVIDGALATRMSGSWRPACPVGLSDLRHVSVSHWNVRGDVVEGELVVHVDVVDDLISVFRRLYDERFPIEQMRLVDDFGADDHASMLANNTSAFNCREVNGRPGVLSQHSYGTAVDINPRVNPWVGSGFVDPPESAAYADRSRRVPGGIYTGDPIVEAFRSIGWQWGGEWADSKDWQHFSASG